MDPVIGQALYYAKHLRMETQGWLKMAPDKRKLKC
jgi:hypothetical protein